MKQRSYKKRIIKHEGLCHDGFFFFINKESYNNGIHIAIANNFYRLLRIMDPLASSWFAGKSPRNSSTIFALKPPFWCERFMRIFNWPVWIPEDNKQLAMNGMDGKWPIYEQFFELRKDDFPQQTVSLPDGMWVCPKLEDVRIHGDIIGIW